MLDRYVESAAELRRVRAMAEQIVTPRLASIKMQEASLAFSLGHWDEVAAEADTVLDLGFLETNLAAAAPILNLAALVAVHRDESETYTRVLGLLQAEGRAAPDHIWGCLARALAAERAGRPEQALADLTAVLEAERDKSNLYFILLPALTRMMSQLGHDGAARKAADLAAQDARETQVPEFEVIARWCRALTDGDPVALLEVADYYRAVEHLCHMANALEDAAVFEARAGRREAARDAITEAMDAYTKLGAVWDARRAKSRLRAEGLQIGARGPRKRPSTGPAALTPTEHQIAQLVARGGTNTEIAERLVLSRRTVEVHVSHILTKLQITSRREVARLITP
jgi:DNA-binding CsgD family transcriptional regulator